MQDTDPKDDIGYRSIINMVHMGMFNTHGRQTYVILTHKYILDKYGTNRSVD